MKSFYQFTFFSTVGSSFKGFKCVIKNFEDPQKIAQTFAIIEKQDLAKFQAPKNIMSIPVQIT